MKVTDLIDALREMPPDAEVWHLWDGALRTEINHVWLARNGKVATADDAAMCYDEESRPESAPTSKEDPHWATPEFDEEPL